MNRVIAAVISLSFAFVMLSGCQIDDQYAMERQYWQVQKQAERIFDNPHASPPNELERVVRLLKKFAEEYPQVGLAVNAEFTIARLYIVKEEYDKAREELRSLLGEHTDSQSISSEALFLIGNTYELEDKWSLALPEYKRIMREHSATPRGLGIPIYIAQHYKLKYQPDKMVDALQEAVEHYRRLADKYAASPLGFRGYSLVAQCYVLLKDWQSVINTLNIIVDRYKDRINVDGVLMDLALVYRRQLNDGAKAKEVLERLIRDYPESKLLNMATALIEEIDKEEGEGQDAETE